MPEQKEPPRPQGDPLGDTAPETSQEQNRAQRQSDAPSDAAATGLGVEESERDGGRGSDANGIPAFDDSDGERRRRLYRDGADIVSRTD